MFSVSLKGPGRYYISYEGAEDSESLSKMPYYRHFGNGHLSKNTRNIRCKIEIKMNSKQFPQQSMVPESPFPVAKEICTLWKLADDISTRFAKV